MAKTAGLYVRLEPEIKQRAESVLARQGISVSAAIEMLYRQIIANQELPFAVDEGCGLLDASEMTGKQLHQMLEKSYQQVLDGEVVTIDKVLADMERGCL